MIFDLPTYLPCPMIYNIQFLGVILDLPTLKLDFSLIDVNLLLLVSECRLMTSYFRLGRRVQNDPKNQTLLDKMVAHGR